MTGSDLGKVGQEQPASLPLLLLLLTVTTGLIDAVSVLGLGRVFTANMTGNVVFLGFALARGPGSARTRPSRAAPTPGLHAASARSPPCWPAPWRAACWSYRSASPGRLP